MLGKIIICTIRDAPQLAPPEREQKLNIRSPFAVEAKLLRRMIAQPHLIFLNSKVQKPVTAEAPPILEPFQIRARFAEKLQFHLLKFTGTECKVARRNFVAERLSDLSDAEGNLFAGGSLYIFKIDENALGSLRP